MLLLLVLNVLALFLVVGALGIVVATRARDSARAFAAAQASQVNSPALARGLLDEALLELIRGPSQPAALGRDVTESLLEDKYGSPSLAGSLTAISASGPIVTATITGISTTNAATLNGRIVTLVPTGTDSTGPTSWRILRVDQGTTTYRLANVRPQTPAPLPTVPCEVLINDREFDGTGNDEPYDAFDANNPFLTQPVLAGSAVSSVARPAFGSAGQPCTVDNDGDGVADGIWLDDVLPSMRSPNGGQLTFSVSYLVLDLDGRINLNAHGSVLRALVPRQFPEQYPQNLSTNPIGMGYGPGDVDASIVVSSSSEWIAGTVPAGYVTLLRGGTVTTNALTSSASQWRPTPRVGTTQNGRYGADAAPGGGFVSGTNQLSPDFWVTGSSPTDFKSRLQVFTSSGSPPTLTFHRPSPAWATADTDDVDAAHPYRLRLDDDAPRASGTSAADAVFTVAELERILRPFDADAASLSPRLAALLDDRAERLRMTVTTESWDTPAITGTAVTRTVNAVTGGNVYDVFSPETAAGLRFDLNRPLTSGSARQDYFKHLYTLVVALTGTAHADAAAQWTANVIEFRDPDSVMSWYPYDANPLDGAWTTGTGVWGAERPEMVITAAAMNSEGTQTNVTLSRPWAATCATTSGSSIPTERIDGRLGNAAANTLNVTRMDGTGTNAAWRLRLVYSATTTTVGLNTLLTSATAVATNANVGTASINGLGLPERVILQRLADPALALGAALTTGTGTNSYVDVESATVGTTGRPGNRWLHWPNRDLVSHGELLAVPASRPDVLASEGYAGTVTSLAASGAGSLILDATIVPSRFAGANVSVPNAVSALAAVGMQNFPHSQLSRWREPGKVNVNTILRNTGNGADMTDDPVWKALLGPTIPWSSSASAPANQASDLLVSGTIPNVATSIKDLNADPNNTGLRYRTAIRLANCATTRSHVFAVWITLRITDSSPNAGPPQFARLFAIVDRSIPVGYSPGRNLNVRETIRLQRFVE